MKQWLSGLGAAALAIVGMQPTLAWSVDPLAGRSDRRQIVLAWAQNQDIDIMRNVRWQALTHLATQFVYFDANANLLSTSTFLNRNAEIKKGGLASRNGVKLLLTLANNAFDETILDTVLTNPTLRNKLITSVVDLATTTTNNAGVDGISLDFEFNWGTTTRDGCMQFIRDLRAALNAKNPPLELSIYTKPTWDANQYDAATLRDYCDYVLPSGYDYATGTGITAVGRYGNSAGFSIIGNTDDYIAAGIPANQIVLALPLYGGKWIDTSSTLTYGNTADSATGALSWPDAQFATKFLAPTPYTAFDSSPLNHYTKWTKFPNGGNTEYWTFDDVTTLEYKLRLAHAWKGAQSTGKPLGGVAFWSLAWLTEANSRDPNSPATATALRRTASPPYTLMEELFAPPGTTRFRAETFEGSTASEGYSARWRDPDTSPDALNVSSANTSRQSATAPSGAPSGSDSVLQLLLQFTSTTNRAFLKHQFLYADSAAPYSLDNYNSLVLVDKNTRFVVDLHVPAGYAGTTIRMVVKDGNNQLEKSPAFSLTTSGWRQISWDLSSTSPGNVTAYSTAEAGVSSGDGTIDTDGAGARDISFAGFEIVSTATTTQMTINFDQIRYDRVTPADRDFHINEFRYADTTAQFIELYGPAGSIPSGLVLRAVRSSDGSTVSEVALTGTVPNDASGSGYWVIGTASVPNVDQTVASSFFQATLPAAVQLYDTVNNRVLDSVVYGAHGGVGLLDSPGKPIVLDAGPGWYGEVANGGDSTGRKYTMGRFPDGAGTGSELDNFSPMPATPGASNGRSISGAVSYDFDVTTPTTQAYRTYNGGTSGNFSTDLPPVGVGSSPNGGRVHRCVDSTGGGAMTYFGDAGLGESGSSNITGQVFVPSNAQPAQAVGVGTAVRSGTTFFSASPATNGYDVGYWLIYENVAGVNLADGQADHPGVWHFVYATNDGLSTSQTVLLGSASNTALGLAAAGGVWTSFRLSVNPSAPAGHQLLASVNGTEVYRGSIPAGGPTSGPFAVGFRENHTGGPAAVEGTWVDALSFNVSPAVPVGLQKFDIE